MHILHLYCFVCPPLYFLDIIDDADIVTLWKRVRETDLLVDVLDR